MTILTDPLFMLMIAFLALGFFLVGKMPESKLPKVATTLCTIALFLRIFMLIFGPGGG